MINNGQWQKLTPDHFQNQNTSTFFKQNFQGSGSFKNLQGQYDISGSTIVFYWKNTINWFLLAFAAIWTSFTSFMVWVFMAAGNVTVNHHTYSSFKEALHADPSAGFIFLFPVLGLIFFYFPVAEFFNKSVFEAGPTGLNVSHGPLPWNVKNLTIPKNNISQCYVERFSPYSENNRPVICFRVKAVQINGPEVILSRGFRSYADARILEQWLENRLEIKDVNYPGEAVGS